MSRKVNEEFTSRVGKNTRLFLYMQSAVELMSDLPPEAPNRYVVYCSVTGGMTQHITKVQAVLGYSQLISRIEPDAPRPAILEWVNGAWKAV